MVSLGAWSAPTTGQPPLANQVNQLLAFHPSTEVRTGTLQASNTTSNAATASTTTYQAQSFTTGASETTIGYVSLPLVPTTGLGASLPPTTVSIYANSAGLPTGTPLVSTVVTAEFAGAQTSEVVGTYYSIPVPVSGLTASTTYWVSASTASSGGNHFSWSESTAGTGAATSTNGTTWTAQAYGLQYKIFDLVGVNPLLSIWEDSGQRWTWVTYNTNKTVNTYSEFTAGQTTAGYLQSVRTFTYSNGLLTGVS